MDDSDTERESQSRAKGKNDARDALSTLSPLTRVAAPEIILILVGVIAIALITRCYYRVEIDSAFLTGLVTFDGLLIASVAFIGQYAYKASEIEGFENEAKRLGNEKQGDPWAEFFSKLFLARRKKFILALVPIFVIMPFFMSAILSLSAMLFSGPKRLLLAAWAFWITLVWFLSIVWLLWRFVLFLWAAYAAPATGRRYHPTINTPTR